MSGNLMEPNLISGKKIPEKTNPLARLTIIGSDGGERKKFKEYEL